MGVEDANDMSKLFYKNLVEKACVQKDEQDMKAGMVGKTKLESLLKDDCKTKEYMGLKSLKDVRDILCVRSNMLEGIKGNHKNMNRNKDMKCGGCNMELDTQSHVLSCEAYRDLSEDKVLSSDEGMIEYFRQVIKRRRKED